MISKMNIRATYGGTVRGKKFLPPPRIPEESLMLYVASAIMHSSTD